MIGIVLAGGDRMGRTYFYDMSNDTWMELGKLAKPRYGAAKLQFIQVLNFFGLLVLLTTSVCFGNLFFRRIENKFISAISSGKAAHAGGCSVWPAIQP